jgi:hypothetical protein
MNSSQKWLSLALLSFLLAVLTGLVAIPPEHVLKVALITALLLLVALIAMVGEQSLANRFDKLDAQTYARRHPGHVRDGKLSCQACNSQAIQERGILDTPDYKALMCTQCNTLLFYKR